MIQDVAVERAMKSISLQMGGLSARQYSIIGNHLYLVYSVGMNEALKLSQTKSKRVISISPSGIEIPYISIREASRSLKLRRDSIKDVLEGKTKTYKNYKFYYEI